MLPYLPPVAPIWCFQFLMNIFKPAFSSTILVIDDFLAGEDAQRVLQECIGLKRIYMPARVLDGPNAALLNGGFRLDVVS